MTENDWRRDDAAYERMIERREELEREDICLGIAEPIAYAVNGWLTGQKLAQGIDGWLTGKSAMVARKEAA